jgi:hypothetical protein
VGIKIFFDDYNFLGFMALAFWSKSAGFLKGGMANENIV